MSSIIKRSLVLCIWISCTLHVDINSGGDAAVLPRDGFDARCFLLTDPRQRSLKPRFHMDLTLALLGSLTLRHYLYSLYGNNSYVFRGRASHSVCFCDLFMVIKSLLGMKVHETFGPGWVITLLPLWLYSWVIYAPFPDSFYFFAITHHCHATPTYSRQNPYGVINTH